ncbi:hypothetical protein QUA70_19825 [Microcoleus sp. LAD1_D5]|uniref:hypothetical protein n=1 Tax=Microcoleus sp. LAD1_D5 TaxID=2818813 RepID=UPI002FD43890
MVFPFASFPAFGFSGSRSSVPSVCAGVAARVPLGARVFVGCAAGVDAFFRGAFPGAVVCSVSFVGRGAFAARSSACVRAVQSAGGLWVSFPSGPCPAGVVPSRRWRSSAGSGSWGSLALAVGLGVPVLVFAPFGVPSGWGFSPLGSGWFCLLPPAQLSLV